MLAGELLRAEIMYYNQKLVWSVMREVEAQKAGCALGSGYSQA